MIKLLFFDTETTGLDSETCGIHQMSGSVVIDGEIVEKFDFKFRPFDDCVFQEDALKLKDLSEEELMSRELSDSDVYNQFVNMLDKYVKKFDKKDKFYIVGYNIGFDINFLKKMFIRNKNEFLFSYFWGNPIDVMSLAGQKLMYFRSGMENFKQGTVAKQLGIPLEENLLHDSLYDVEVLMKIYSLVTNYKINFGK